MMQVVKNFILFLVLGTTCNSFASSTDLLIFSYNRPLQLYALLESVEKYISNLGQTYVLYRSDGQNFEQAYQQVQQRFPAVNLTRQGNNPRADFKPLTLKIIFKDSSADYILFAVDDIVVKDYFDLNTCMRLLEETDAYGFYLKFGLYVDKCYTMDCWQGIPPLEEVENGVYQWQFKDGLCDWNYPNTVDMTVYRKKDIRPLFESMTYHSPNTLEGAWAQHPDMSQYGLFFAESKEVNLPLNLVQTDWENLISAYFSAEELLDFFNQGLKMDIAPLFQIKNESAHIAYKPTFIEREPM